MVLADNLLISYEKELGGTFWETSSNLWIALFCTTFLFGVTVTVLENMQVVFMAKPIGQADGGDS